MAVFLRVAVVALIAFGFWRAVRTRWAFTIVVDQSGVRSHTGITTPQQQRLLELLQKTRFVKGQVKVCGRHDTNGRLQLRFFGNISDDARQQIRNFLVNEL